MENLPPELLYEIAAEVQAHRPSQVRVETRNLRALLRTVLGNASLASLVYEISLEWEEYLLEPSDPYRIYPPPPEFPIAPSVSDVELFGSAIQRDHSGLGLKTRLYQKLIEGSADAESTLLLHSLVKLKRLRLAFPFYVADYCGWRFWEYGVDWDGSVSYDKWEDGPHGIFQHPILLSYLRQAHRPSKNSSQHQQSLQELEQFEMRSPFEDPWTMNFRFPPCMFWELSQLRDIILLPKHRRISLERCRSPLRHDKEFEDRPSNGVLENLSLSDAAITKDDLAVLLGLSRGLIVFKYHAAKCDEVISVDPELQDRSILSSHTTLQARLISLSMSCPQSLLACLLKHRETLRNLDLRLHLFEQKGWADASIDKTGAESNNLVEKLDLRPFTSVEHISVLADDLFGLVNLGKLEFSGSLSQVLPTSLQTLSLKLSNRFSHHDDEQQLPVLATHPHWWHQLHYAHVNNLLLCKEKFPLLHRIRLAIPPDWSEPDDLISRAAKAAGVILVIEREDSIVNSCFEFPSYAS